MIKFGQSRKERSQKRPHEQYGQSLKDHMDLFKEGYCPPFIPTGGIVPPRSTQNYLKLKKTFGIVLGSDTNVINHEALRLDLGCIRSLYNQSTSILTDNGKLTAEERTWHLFSFPAAKNRTITYVGQIIKCLEDDILGVQFYRTVSRTERTFRKDSESTEFVYHGEYELVLQLPPAEIGNRGLIKYKPSVF